MRRNKKRGIVFAGTAAITMALLTSVVVGHVFAQQTQDIRSTLSPTAKNAFDVFEQRAKDYVKLRDREKNKLPKLSDESKAEEIETHKQAFQKAVRAARSGAKHGDVFTPDITSYIRATIKAEFRGKERAELRSTVLVESDAKGIPLRVNYTYPEDKEQIEMAPTLLLKLPQLPKELRYRFAGRGMLLVDRDNGLIIDYMTNALP